MLQDSRWLRLPPEYLTPTAAPQRLHGLPRLASVPWEQTLSLFCLDVGRLYDWPPFLDLGLLESPVRRWIAGSAKAATTVALSMAMMSVGVPFGAHKPN
jgi:hypothetical protein